MTECIQRPEVREYFTCRLSRENTIVAIYLDESLATDDNLATEIIEEYLIVYTTNELKDKVIDDQYINAVDSLVRFNYESIIGSNWKDLLNNVNCSQAYKNLGIEAPILLDHFLVTEGVPCAVTLSNVTENNTTTSFLTATSLINLNGQFIACAWYKHLEKIVFGSASYNSILKSLKSKIQTYCLDLKEKNNRVYESKVEQNNAAVIAFNSAYEKSNQGDYSGAIAYYTDAINLYTDDLIKYKSEAYFNRGVNKRQMNDLDGAYADYSAAIKLRPDYYRAYCNRGVVELKKKNLQEAISDFTVVINSGNHENKLLLVAHENRGLAKILIGEDGCQDIQTAAKYGVLTKMELLMKCNNQE